MVTSECTLEKITLNTRTQANCSNSRKKRDDMLRYCRKAVIKQVPENGKRHDNSKWQHLNICCFWRYGQTTTSHTKRWPSRWTQKKEKKDRLVSWIHACFWGKSWPWKDFPKSSGFSVPCISVWGQKTELRREKQKYAHTLEALSKL